MYLKSIEVNSIGLSHIVRMQRFVPFEYVKIVRICLLECYGNYFYLRKSKI